ncbi:MAG: FHA domain-containing protein [Anaerolineae bacterium]|nr:FHA domain-containing protein [Anaerolineae bacterium]
MSEKHGEMKCPSCGSENLPGTLFCVQCGTYLPSGGPLRTEPFSEQSQMRARPWTRDSGNDDDRVVGIELEVLETHRRVLLSAESDILIGRLDAAHGIFPEMDLTADGGLEHGVSRRQARIYVREGGWFVEDLDSTNGTFLNDERLTPYLPYRFHDSDIITLGTLRVQIMIHRESKAVI